MTIPPYVDHDHDHDLDAEAADDAYYDDLTAAREMWAGPGLTAGDVFSDAELAEMCGLRARST